jgi:hypothetical protein
VFGPSDGPSFSLENKELDCPQKAKHLNQPDVWLRYYASEENHEGWAETNVPLPPQENPPYPGKMPRRP